jgi:putative permease
MALTKTIPPFYSKLAAVLVSLIALFYIAIEGKSILAPLFFALLFAVMLLPLAGLLERRLRFPRSLAALFSVILLVLFVGALFYLVGSQISSLADDWPQFKEQVQDSLKDLQHWIYVKFRVSSRQQMTYVNNATTRILNTGPGVIGDALSSVSGMLVSVIFMLIDTFFLLYYRRLIIRFLISVFKEENSLTVYDIIAQVQSRIRSYIFGLLLEMVIVATVSCLALYFLGIKYAILLGLITGLFNVVPYIGIFSATLLSALVTFATAASAGKALLAVVALLGIHIVDANVLLPLVVGSKVRINALVTLLGVIIGEAAWGIAGMFLAIPVIAIAKIIFDRVPTLKPWGMLLGDEKDEQQPEPLKEEVLHEEVKKEEGEHKPGS